MYYLLFKLFILVNFFIFMQSQTNNMGVKEVALKENLTLSSYLYEYMQSKPFVDNRKIGEGSQAGYELQENYNVNEKYTINFPKSLGSSLESLEFYLDLASRNNETLKLQHDYGFNISYPEDLMTTYMKPLNFYHFDKKKDYSFEFNLYQPQIQASFKSNYISQLQDVVTFQNILLGIDKSLKSLKIFAFEKENLKEIILNDIFSDETSVILKNKQFLKLILDSNKNDKDRHLLLIDKNSSVYILKFETKIGKASSQLLLTYTENLKENPIVDFVEKDGIFYIGHENSIILRDIKKEINKIHLEFALRRKVSLIPKISDIHRINNAIYVLIKNYGLKIFDISDPQGTKWTEFELFHPYIHKISSYSIPYYDSPFLAVLVNSRLNHGNEFFFELELKNEFEPLVFRYYLSEKYLDINYIQFDEEFTYLFEHNSNSVYTFSRSVTSTSRNSVYRLHIGEISNREVNSAPFTITDETLMYNHLGLIAENKFVFSEKIEYTNAVMEISFKKEGKYKLDFHTYSDYCNLNKEEVLMCLIALNFNLNVNTIKGPNYLTTVLFIALICVFIGLLILILCKLGKIYKWLKSSRYIEFYSGGESDQNYNRAYTVENTKPVEGVVMTNMEKA
jgi:hypothetical protein